MYNFLVIFLLVIRYSSCSISLMMRYMDTALNGHRRNASLPTFRWNDSMATEAFNFAFEYCGDNTSPTPWGMTLGKLDLGVSTTDQDVAEQYMTHMYKNATTSYLFKGENSSYNGCYDGTNDFIYAADFLVTWMRPNITKFGCAVYECGLYNYLFACSFWPQPENKSVPLFTNENFLSLCKTERGLWRSCRNALNQQCIDEGYPNPPPPADPNRTALDNETSEGVSLHFPRNTPLLLSWIFLQWAFLFTLIIIFF